MCKTRPAGQVRPATRFCPAREMFLKYNGNWPAAFHRPPIHYTIGLYRENAIAIESEARDPFGGNVYYVTMQITFPIPEFARKERNLHCDVVHVTPKWVSRFVLDNAIQTSR